MRRWSTFLTGMALMVLPVAAEAALYQFDLHGSRAANFRLEATRPDFFSTLQTQFQNVPGTYAGLPGTASAISFGAVFFINGLDISGTPLGFTQFGGAPLFSGPTSRPVFTPGTYALSGIVSGESTLQITAVPEPAVWGMMLFGFTMVGATMRRRVARLA